MHDLLEQIEREGIVDNQKSVTIDDAIVEFKFAKRNTASSLEPTTTGLSTWKVLHNGYRKYDNQTNGYFIETS